MTFDYRGLRFLINKSIHRFCFCLWYQLLYKFFYLSSEPANVQNTIYVEFLSFSSFSEPILL